jgi:hypothetical protein
MPYTRLLACLLWSACILPTTPDDKDPGSSDPNTPGNTSGAFSALVDPCNGATPYEVAFISEDEGYVGCGSEQGLHYTTDGGQTFVDAIISDNLYVYQVLADGSGDVLVCGQDYDTDALVYRGSGTNWEAILYYGSASDYGDQGVFMGTCGEIGMDGAGGLVVNSIAGIDVTASTDDGASWSAPNDLWELSNVNGTCQASTGRCTHQISRYVSTSQGLYGAGSTDSEPPLFFRPGSAELENLEKVVIDENMQGLVWSLATTDDGQTWLAGGRDDRESMEASGFIYRSTDGGETWDSLPLGPEIDVVYDIAIAEDGQHGVAVGHRYPPSSLGGFVLLTEDGGATWTEVDEDVPILQSCEARGSTWWAAGGGFLARGDF